MSELRCTVCGYAWPDSDIPDRAIPRLDAHCPRCDQMRTFAPPSDLEPDDSDEATLEGDLGSVGDDEYFAALEEMPALLDEDGTSLDAAEGVRDERR